MAQAERGVTYRIAILDDYQRVALDLADWSELAARAEITVFDRHITQQEAPAALAGFEILCLLRERMAFPGGLLRQLPNLRMISCTGPHNRTLDLETATDLGIAVSCTGRPRIGTGATSELAWGLILSLLRNIPQEAGNMRAGGWQQSVGTVLEGKTLGLVGLGRLGGMMVPVARAFGMDIIAWSQNLTDEAAASKGARRVEKAELFANADIISLHLVLGPRSRGIVGAGELAMMKKTAFLVNTARGPLVDSDALVAALREGRISGAALDVFDDEPLPPSDRLRSLPGTLLTPHLGYTVKELLQPFYAEAVRNVVAWIERKEYRAIRP